MSDNYLILKNEIDLIQDSEIKDFVIESLKIAPEYFWTVASSTSGKYHPEFALGEGGLIRHVKVVVKLANELVVAYQLEKYKDYIIAAAILHDICKNGILYKNGVFNKSEGNVTKSHGVFTRDLLQKVACKDSKKFDNIMRLVSKHMGRWSPDGYIPETPSEWCVHIADYVASRKFIDIKWDK